jgi:hypothetical protein
MIENVIHFLGLSGRGPSVPQITRKLPKHMKDRIHILLILVPLCGVLLFFLYKIAQEYYIGLADDYYFNKLLKGNPSCRGDVDQIMGNLPHWVVQNRKKQTAILFNEVIPRLYPDYKYVRYRIAIGTYIDVIYSKDFREVALIFPHYALKKPERIMKIEIRLDGNLSREQNAEGEVVTGINRGINWDRQYFCSV